MFPEAGHNYYLQNKVLTFALPCGTICVLRQSHCYYRPLRVFLFAPPQPVQFWMKHCRISLDIIFLRQGKVIAIFANTPPCTADPCPVYGPNEPIDQVIEIRGGQAASLGLTVGANVEVQQLKTPR